MALPVHHRFERIWWDSASLVPPYKNVMFFSRKGGWRVIRTRFSPAAHEKDSAAAGVFADTLVRNGRRW
ncbi:MAG: hypothetical protein GX594_03070 [Pirellulaceae bacterium]|nr:hypothetical protein [Pirellulaceae bacterium]